MREVELFHGFETGRRKMAEQALVVETWLGNDACCAWLIQPQIMAQTAQPAADILRAAPVFFPNQHVQAAVKRLPAIVAANTVFRRPVNFKVAERLVIKSADKRITIGRVELTAQVIFLLRLRAGHLPEGVNARGVHPAGETFAVLRHIGHAETQGVFNLRVVTAIDFTLRAVRAQRK